MSAPFGGPPALPFNTADAPPAARRPRARRHDLRRARGADAAAQALPALLHDARGEREHVARRAGHPRVPARLLPHEKRRLEAEPAGAARGANRERVGEAAALLRDGSRQGHGGDRRARRCRRPPRSPRTSGCPTPSCASTAANAGGPGFQGGLEGYRTGSSGRFTSEQQLFAGRTIDVPSMFIGGKSDWGVYQNPGALERMQKVACTKMIAHAPGRRRRALGAAGAAGGGQPAARRIL